MRWLWELWHRAYTTPSTAPMESTWSSWCHSLNIMSDWCHISGHAPFLGLAYTEETGLFVCHRLSPERPSRQGPFLPVGYILNKATGRWMSLRGCSEPPAPHPGLSPQASSGFIIGGFPCWQEAGVASGPLPSTLSWGCIRHGCSFIFCWKALLGYLLVHSSS